MLDLAASVSSLSSINVTRSSLPDNDASSSQEKPFVQQLNYHLQDLKLVRRNLPLPPEGKLKIHLPDISFIEVDFNRRESIELVRQRIQTQLNGKFDVSKYYLVSPKGAIEDGTTLDECFITPGMDILMIRKGIKNRQRLANRRFWIKSREANRRGEPRPSTTSLSLPKIKNKHRITPYPTSHLHEQEIKNKRAMEKREKKRY